MVGDGKADSSHLGSPAASTTRERGTAPDAAPQEEGGRSVHQAEKEMICPLVCLIPCSASRRCGCGYEECMRLVSSLLQPRHAGGTMSLPYARSWSHIFILRRFSFLLLPFYCVLANRICHGVFFEATRRSYRGSAAFLGFHRGSRVRSPHWALAGVCEVFAFFLSVCF